MNERRKRIILAVVYLTVLLTVGLVMIFVTSSSKIDTLLEIVYNSEYSIDTRLNAMQSLVVYDDPAVTEMLINSLDNEDPYIKMRAAMYAGERREYTAIPLLIQNLKDNTMLLHPRSGSMLPQVKIYSYQALKKITRKDFGPIEGSPIEVAETVRRWEYWWYHNAEVYGMQVEDIEPDYHALVLNVSIPLSNRMRLLLEAERKKFAGLADIIVRLLEIEPSDSLLLKRAILVAGREKIEAAIPGLIKLLNDKTLLPASPELRLDVPLMAILANESLVQITGQDFGTIYRHMPEKDKTALIQNWKQYLDDMVTAKTDADQE